MRERSFSKSVLDVGDHRLVLLGGREVSGGAHEILDLGGGSRRVQIHLVAVEAAGAHMHREREKHTRVRCEHGTRTRNANTERQNATLTRRCTEGCPGRAGKSF